MPRRPTLDQLLRSPSSRRRFLVGTTSAAALVLAAQQTDLARRAERLLGFTDDPFTLGVASGDPTPSGVVLWTRLAPDPIHGGGLDHVGPIDVDWVVARDEGLRQVVGRGTASARPELAHSVHVEVDGLEPGHDYWYRFQARGHASPTGRTRTAPAAGTVPAQLRLGFCSCSNYQGGYFAAYRHLAAEHLDLVLHLGDYIYELGPVQFLPGRVHTTPAAGPHVNQLTTLADYRNRHALYKTDPALQAAHAAAPWAVVWDDHDVENNYAGDSDPEDGVDPAVFLLRRAAAYQAYYEHLPLRRTSVPHGPDMRIYRRLRFGDLLDLHLLDTRQYRTDQPVDRSTPHASAAADRDFRPDLPPGGNPSGTLLGQAQEQWLLDGLRQSPTRWNALGNQVTMARFDNGPYQPATRGGPHDFNMDAWDGYGAERQRILDTIGARPDLGVVVLTGDVHGAFVHDLEADFTHPGEPVATEFIGTSITSGYPPVDWVATERAAREASPWTHYVDVRRRGYATCTVTPDAWRTDFHTVDSTADQGLVVAKDAALRTDASFVVEHGRAGAQPA